MKQAQKKRRLCMSYCLEEHTPYKKDSLSARAGVGSLSVLADEQDPMYQDPPAPLLTIPVGNFSRETRVKVGH